MKRCHFVPLICLNFGREAFLCSCHGVLVFPGLFVLPVIHLKARGTLVGEDDTFLVHGYTIDVASPDGLIGFVIVGQLELPTFFQLHPDEQHAVAVGFLRHEVRGDGVICSRRDRHHQCSVDEVVLLVTHRPALAVGCPGFAKIIGFVGVFAIEVVLHQEHAALFDHCSKLRW